MKSNSSCENLAPPIPIKTNTSVARQLNRHSVSDQLNANLPSNSRTLSSNRSTTARKSSIQNGRVLNMCNELEKRSASSQQSNKKTLKTTQPPPIRRTETVSTAYRYDKNPIKTFTPISNQTETNTNTTNSNKLYSPNSHFLSPPPNALQKKQRSFLAFGFGAGGSGPSRRESHVNVNVTPTSHDITSDTPEIRKYKKRFNSEILCAALWGVNLLIGTENGLMLLDRSGQGKVKLIPLFKQ